MTRGRGGRFLVLGHAARAGSRRWRRRDGWRERRWRLRWRSAAASSRRAVAFARLLLGVMAKWVVVVAVFALVLGAWRLPPLPVLVGLAVGMLAYLVALNWSGARAG